MSSTFMQTICFIPQYELLFSVQDDNDPAILVVKSLIDSYPKVDAKLFIGKFCNINKFVLINCQYFQFRFLNLHTNNFNLKTLHTFWFLLCLKLK